MCKDFILDKLWSDGSKKKAESFDFYLEPCLTKPRIAKEANLEVYRTPEVIRLDEAELAALVKGFLGQGIYLLDASTTTFNTRQMWRRNPFFVNTKR